MDLKMKRIKVIAEGIRRDMEALDEVDLTFIEVATAVQVLSILYDRFPDILKIYKDDKKHYEVLNSWYKNQDLKINEKELIKEIERNKEVN